MPVSKGKFVPFGKKPSKPKKKLDKKAKKKVY